MSSALNKNTTSCLTSTLLPDTVTVAATPLIAWTALVILGSITSNNILSALSLKRSIKELLTGRSSKLDFIDIFRCVAIIWVMINHTGGRGRIDVLEGLSSAEAFTSAMHNHPIFGALMGNSALGVEIFLVLSGLLAARSWLRKADEPFFQHWITFIIRRILRLAPVMFIFIYIAIGPIMKKFLPRFTFSSVSSCGFWNIISLFTFTGNLQTSPTCMTYIWYLGLDMQLYMVASIFLSLLHKSPKRGIVLTITTIIASMFIRAGYCTAYGTCNHSDVDVAFITKPGQDPAVLARSYEGLWLIYSRPYTKCGPFLIGLLLGYTTVSSKYIMSDALTKIVFRSSLFVAIATIYAILPEYWNPNAGNTLYNTVYTAVFRSVFAMAISGMIAAMYFKEGCSSTPLVFSILGKLTFNTYLLHMPVVYTFNWLSFLQTATSPIELFLVIPFIAMLSYVAALFFYLFVEAPMGNLMSQSARRLGL
ncbi:Acyltransferase 3 domain-containing protein [Caenorhabditis elegans]|uniref:Acyltransferase 3 domain-containing protein n=1 Tax=Caenorhabditis elegans TaxID=6239 RepID=Q9XVW0_CAEEL|nr:Acyltransferase 3 domain-containing protein [Caenorhabditis elegans]CAA92707.3 Acyltransferase 3 domain-containing protein [Caenorhabditis elegans]|eukprot:NP_495953.3 O-ACyltransferase homolog [Caenorhabditis elegans]